MAIRTVTVSLLLLLSVVAVGCSDGSSEDGASGVSLDDPIGAPDPGAAYGTTATEPALEASVVKNAHLEMDVDKGGLAAAAQKVVDVATAARTGGFLVSSSLDLDDGYGTGFVVVKVPSDRFERVVFELGSIGTVTAQQLTGEDLTPEVLSARRSAQDARERIAHLLQRIQNSDDEAVAAELGVRLRAARGRLDDLTERRASIRGQASYSTINVDLVGSPPPPPSRKPVIERAIATARSISLGILSGVVLAAGVVVPLGLVALLSFLAARPLLRRMKPRWGIDA